MTAVQLEDYWRQIERRKAELGMVDTPESIAAMRNKGQSRSLAKRALLTAIEDRARAAGRTLAPTYFERLSSKDP